MARIRPPPAKIEGRLNVRVPERRCLGQQAQDESRARSTTCASLAVSPEKRLKLVANLPYNVATPILNNLLIHPELCPSLMVVTIQLKLAQRICAEPEQGDYGALSVLMQSLADVSIVRNLPPTVFWPRPKVDSAVIVIRPNAEKGGCSCPTSPGSIRRFASSSSIVAKPAPGPLQSLARPLDEARGRHVPRRPRPDRLWCAAEAMNVEELLTLTQQLGERFNVDQGTLPELPDDESEEGEDDIEDDEPDASASDASRRNRNPPHALECSGGLQQGQGISLNSRPFSIKMLSATLRKHALPPAGPPILTGCARATRRIAWRSLGQPGADLLGQILVSAGLLADIVLRFAALPENDRPSRFQVAFRWPMIRRSPWTYRRRSAAPLRRSGRTDPDPDRRSSGFQASRSAA